ncbi:MAG TPA: MraY family glycosyltransferase [Elusimicrobiota bacterium]|nr:MraY family glycosyltransferase [Elusimicrobiota bacterium]
MNRLYRPIHLWLLTGLILFLIPPGWVSAWAWQYGLRWAFVLAIALFMTSLFTPLCIHYAFRLNVLDIPNDRKMHSHPIPRMGGLAIYLALLLTTVRNFQFSREVSGLMAAVTVIFVVSLIDDIRGLSAFSRLAAQLVAAGILLSSGVRINFIPAMPGEALIEMAITVVWLVGITNAFNFLDGVDGLAGGMGVVCASLFFVIAWETRQSYISYFMAALTGGCLGFLPYNWRPARIFLGDSGSTLIGFSLAGLAVIGTWADNNPVVALSTPLLILSIPIFDMIYTTVSRIKNDQVHNVREWLEFTGKDHFHHRLMHLGLDEKRTVGFILIVNLCLGLGAVVIRNTANPLGAGLLLFQAVLIFIMIVILMLLGRQTSSSS